MRTIIDSNNCSKYLLKDDKRILVNADSIEVSSADKLLFIIGDLNSGNSTLIEGVTTPDDWYGCKYNHVGGAWELCLDWVDPRLEVIAT